MQLNTFEQQMTDVTELVLSAYYQDIDNDWQKAVIGKYDSDIAYHLLKTLIATDGVNNDNDLDEFAVEDNDALKALVQESFDALVIYEISPELTAQIINYFKPIGIDIKKHFTNAVLSNPQDGSHYKAYLYVVIDKNLDFATELNCKVFAGQHGQTDSLDHFLKQH